MTAYYNEFDPKAAAWLRELIDAALIAPGDVDERSICDVKGEDLAGYTQIHMFAGIGGWSYALRLAGWPDDRPVWSGSAPCQPFSNAGKRAGVKDERHLWPVFCSLIKECRPQVVFGEQVASAEVVGTQLEADFALAVQVGDYARANKLAKRLVKANGFHFQPRWIDGVCSDLEEAGYSFGFKVLGAHSVGAPHIRQRVFWMADSGSERWERRPCVIGDRRQEAQRSETVCDSGNDCRRVGMGDATGNGRHARSGGTHGNGHPEERNRASEPCGAGTDCGLVHPEHRRSALEESGAESGGSGISCRVGYSHNSGETPIAGVSEGAHAQCGRGVGGMAYAYGGEPRDGELQRGGQYGQQPEDGRSSGFWDAYELIYCRDEKYRRIEPGAFPLVARLPTGMVPSCDPGLKEVQSTAEAKQSRLKGYGNAINPYVAAEFVAAYLATTGTLR